MDKNPTPQPSGVVACTHYPRSGDPNPITLDAVSDVLAVDNDGFVWIALYEPDEATLRHVQMEFDLHELAIEDAQVAHQRPKIEAYGETLFLAVKTAQTVDRRVKFGETHMFFDKRFLITVRHGSSMSYANARKRLEREPHLMAQGSAGAIYVVLDAIVDNYLPLIDDFNHQLNSLEEEVLAETFHPTTIQRLYELKLELTKMRIAASPLADIVAQLLRTRKDLVTKKIQPYLRDVHDHALRLNDGMDTIREMLSAAMATNLSLVTVRQGEVVKRLGAWAALLAVPTLVASWYGMNFKFMPELGTRWSYPIVIGAVGLICIVLYRSFRKSGWL